MRSTTVWNVVAAIEGSILQTRRGIVNLDHEMLEYGPRCLGELVRFGLPLLRTFGPSSDDCCDGTRAASAPCPGAPPAIPTRFSFPKSCSSKHRSTASFRS